MNIYSSVQSGNLGAVAFSPGIDVKLQTYIMLPYVVKTSPDIIAAFIDPDTVYLKLSDGTIYSKPASKMLEEGIPQEAKSQDVLEWLLHRQIVNQDMAKLLFKTFDGYKMYEKPSPPYKWRIFRGKLEVQT